MSVGKYEVGGMDGEDDAALTGVDGADFFVGRKVGDWVWCLHCDRCYQVGEYKLSDYRVEGRKLQLCPYDDCDGDTVFDAWPWQDYYTGAGWPQVPDRGKEYPR